MSQINATVRERIQAQGFCGLDDATYAQINYPLRLTPAIYLVWVGVGTTLASPMILWALAPFAALGAILRVHPFDALYNYGLRHLTGGPALPRYGARRRFGYALAPIMVIAAAWCFQTGATMVGYVIGWSMVAGAAVNVSNGFCIAAFLVRIFFGRVASEQSTARPQLACRRTAATYLPRS